MLERQGKTRQASCLSVGESESRRFAESAISMGRTGRLRRHAGGIDVRA